MESSAYSESEIDYLIPARFHFALLNTESTGLAFRRKSKETEGCGYLLQNLHHFTMLTCVKTRTDGDRAKCADECLLFFLQGTYAFQALSEISVLHQHAKHPKSV